MRWKLELLRCIDGEVGVGEEEGTCCAVAGCALGRELEAGYGRRGRGYNIAHASASRGHRTTNKSI